MEHPTRLEGGRKEISTPQFPTSPPDTEQVGSLSAPFARMAAELAGEPSFSAPVLMPGNERLAVRMVRADVLSQLDDARGEANLHQSFTFSLAGAVLGGLAAALVTTGNGYTVNEIVLGASGALGAVTFVFGGLWYRAARKVASIKRVLLEN